MPFECKNIVCFEMRFGYNTKYHQNAIVFHHIIHILKIKTFCCVCIPHGFDVLENTHAYTQRCVAKKIRDQKKETAQKKYRRKESTVQVNSLEECTNR